MKEEEVKFEVALPEGVKRENEKRLVFSKLNDDSTHYFAQWGSRNPLLTINEEIDNQIAAEPTRASLTIVQSITETQFIFENDGITPDTKRMQKMMCIGKTHSDKRGASICGVGQIEGLIAGRRDPLAVSTLTFKSVHDNLLNTFTVTVNGTNNEITGNVDGPDPIYERDFVSKSFSNMLPINPLNNNEEMKRIEALIAIKIYGYAKDHPDFTYTFNNKVIKPESVLYEHVNDSSIARLKKKEYKLSYHGKEYLVYLEGAQLHKYLKPDGVKYRDENDLILYDRAFPLNGETSGVYVEIGGCQTIKGGPDSWHFVKMQSRSTASGIRLLITIPAEGELKEAIFAESPNKGEVGISLDKIVDWGGKLVFEEMLKDIKTFVNGNSTGRARRKCTEKRFEEIMSDCAVYFADVFEQMDEEQIDALRARPLSHIYDYVKKIGLLNREHILLNLNASKNENNTNRF